VEFRLIGPDEAAGIPPQELVTKPFFGMGTREFRRHLFTSDTSAVNRWLDDANLWRMLSGAIPAKSLAAGVNDIQLEGVPNIDLLSDLRPGYWPDRGTPAWRQRNWLHSDVRNMAYIYTYPVYSLMVIEGGLE